MTDKLNTIAITTIIIGIVILIIIFNILAETAPVIGAVAGNITCTSGVEIACISNATGFPVSEVLPLTGFFKKKGVIILGMISGIILLLITRLLLKADITGGK